MLYLGVDLGGTNIKAALVSENGEIVKKAAVPTNLPRTAQDVCDDIAALCLQLGAGEPVASIGVGCPGTVCDGVVLYSNNLDWHDFAMADYLQAKTRLPVCLGNDANVAALGEMWQGGGKGYSNLVAVTLGTGVGGGIIIDGRILTGTNGAGGEIGHIHMEDNETEVCGCKNKGCLEQYASATGITRLANRRLAKDDAPSILRGGEISAKTVFDAVKAGDKVAIEIAEQFGEYLGKGLAAVASVVDPQIFVIGGGVSKAGDILFKYIEPSYKRCAFGPCKQAKFALAKLGNDAGIYGAAALVLK